MSQEVRGWVATRRQLKNETRFACPSTHRCLTRSCGAVYHAPRWRLTGGRWLAPPPYRRPVRRPPDDVALRATGDPVDWGKHETRKNSRHDASRVLAPCRVLRALAPSFYVCRRTPIGRDVGTRTRAAGPSAGRVLQRSASFVVPLPALQARAFNRLSMSPNGPSRLGSKDLLRRQCRSRIGRPAPGNHRRGCVLGGVSHGKVRHACCKSPAPTPGFPRKTDILPLFAFPLIRMGFRGSPVRIRPSRLAEVGIWQQDRGRVIQGRIARPWSLCANSVPTPGGPLQCSAREVRTDLMELSDLRPGALLRGLIPDQLLPIIASNPSAGGSVDLTYRNSAGNNLQPTTH